MSGHEPTNRRSPATLLQLYKSMVWIRQVELSISGQYAKQNMRCPVHLSIGQEGAAVSVCAALSAQDQIYSNHRCHAHYLAKGGNLDAMLGELHGKSTGCCGGRGGSMHLFDDAAGVAGSIPIVGSSIPLAVGNALAKKQRGEPGCSVVFLGDGATEQGVFHESLNFASVHRLPVLFVIENNLYSVYTKLQDRQPLAPLTRHARAHGIDHRHADASEVERCHTLALSALQTIDAGAGPIMLVLDTYRYLAHCGPEDDDGLGYRPRDEVASFKDRCPLRLTKDALEAREQWSEAQDLELLAKNQQRIDAAFADAMSAPLPHAMTATEHVYAPVAPPT